MSSPCRPLRLAQAYLRETLVTKHAKQCQCPRRVLLLSVVTLAMLPFVAKALCPCGLFRKPIDTSGWGLREFVDHLNTHELPLHVVPSRADGKWTDNLYLTTDPKATWSSIQLKNQTAARIDHWWGVVWLHRIGPSTDPESQLQQWDGRGRRIDGFLLFGDPTLLDRIEKTFPRRRGQSSSGR